MKNPSKEKLIIFKIIQKIYSKLEDVMLNDISLKTFQTVYIKFSFIDYFERNHTTLNWHSLDCDNTLRDTVVSQLMLFFFLILKTKWLFIAGIVCILPAIDWSEIKSVNWNYLMRVFFRPIEYLLGFFFCVFCLFLFLPLNHNYLRY